MSALNSLVDFAIGAAEIAFPEAAAALAIVRRFAPYTDDAVAILKDAVTEGPEAFAAAKAKAPDLFGDITAVLGKLKQIVGDATPVSDHELALAVAHIAKVDPPGWTHDATVRWWDRADNTR